MPVELQVNGLATLGKYTEGESTSADDSSLFIEKNEY